ncbi:unnamed protein product [Ectocarpus sp. CCAP 1310/34]|nr:unnamed protein product [Ectocarpus sp. CCAP 1310/34]
MVLLAASTINGNAFFLSSVPINRPLFGSISTNCVFRWRIQRTPHCSRRICLACFLPLSV